MTRAGYIHAVGRKVIIGLVLLTGSAILPAAGMHNDEESKHLFEDACTQCHGLNIIEKTRNGRAGWEDTVHKMVVAGAQLDADEMESVIDYLSQHFGPGSGDPMKTGLLPHDSPLQIDGSISSDDIHLPKDRGMDQVQTYCQMCHDLGRIVATRRGADEWRQYTRNMIDRAELDISNDDFEDIVSYLRRHFGKTD